MVQGKMDYPMRTKEVSSTGRKGGKGLHTTASKIMALAKKSGVGENESRSKFGDHQITSEELETLGIKHHNETALGQVDRYRGIIGFTTIVSARGQL